VLWAVVEGGICGFAHLARLDRNNTGEWLPLLSTGYPGAPPDRQPGAPRACPCACPLTVKCDACLNARTEFIAYTERGVGLGKECASEGGRFSLRNLHNARCCGWITAAGVRHLPSSNHPVDYRIDAGRQGGLADGAILCKGVSQQREASWVCDLFPSTFRSVGPELFYQTSV